MGSSRSSGQHATTWIEWSDRGQTRRVAVDRRLTVGRAPSNTIVLSDARVSRVHCVIRPIPGGIAIDASRSANGVIVDGQRLSRATVAPGGAFHLGGMAFRIGDSGELGRATARQATALLPRRLLVLAGAAGIAATVFMTPVVVFLRTPGDAGVEAPTAGVAWQLPEGGPPGVRQAVVAALTAEVANEGHGWAVTTGAMGSDAGVFYASETGADAESLHPELILVTRSSARWEAVTSSSTDFCRTLLRLPDGVISHEGKEYFVGCRLDAPHP
jgi:hypothetical protein